MSMNYKQETSLTLYMDTWSAIDQMHSKNTMMKQLNQNSITDQIDENNRMDRKLSPCPMWTTPSYPEHKKKVKRGTILDFPGNVVPGRSNGLSLCSSEEGYNTINF